MRKDTSPHTHRKIDDMDYSTVVLRELFEQKYKLGTHTIHQTIYQMKSSISTTNPLKSRRKYGRKLKWFQDEEDFLHKGKN